MAEEFNRVSEDIEKGKEALRTLRQQMSEDILVRHVGNESYVPFDGFWYGV